MLVRFTVRGQGVLKKNLLKPRSSSKFTDVKPAAGAVILQQL